MKHTCINCKYLTPGPKNTTLSPNEVERALLVIRMTNPKTFPTTCKSPNESAIYDHHDTLKFISEEECGRFRSRFKPST